MNRSGMPPHDARVGIVGAKEQFQADALISVLVS
jgi:hypothetical protein